MASYFLPSYFQRRILRYALSRLDFLETDALDLENLGITWGQTSVVELKNVGIQIKKLTDVISLPPSIVLTRARIRLIRLIVPADLYRTGIVAEIEGIEVILQLDTSTTSVSGGSIERRADTAPSRGSRANRPRISSPAIHDPGGQSIPSSQDLAVSFLQSEPVEERYELQAAIQSQSQQLHESTISSSTTGDDLGLGVPGGISLPTFVADFFKGIVDRLSVKIKDVSISVDMDLPQDGPDQNDSVSLTFTLAELVMHGIHPQLDNPPLDGQRSIEMQKIEILLKSEPDLLSPTSATSSPKLSKSRSKMTSTGSRSSTTESETFGSIDRDLQRPTNYTESSSARSAGSNGHSESSSDDSPAFASARGLGLDSLGSITKSSASLEDSIESSQASQLWAEEAWATQDSVHDIDNQAHAEELARTSTFDSADRGPDPPGLAHSDDLAESRMFTHDEAESMYLSAVSGGLEDEVPSNAMPGAWDWSSSKPASDIELRGPGLIARNSVSVESEKYGTETPVAKTGVTAALTSGATGEMAEKIEAVDEHSDRSANFVSKRVMLINSLFLALPTSREKNNPKGPETSPGPSRPSKSRSEAAATAKNFHSAIDPFPSQLFYSQPAITDETRRPVSVGSVPDLLPDDMDHPISVHVGTVTIALDLTLGKLIVRACQEGLRAQPKKHDSEQPQTKPALPEFDLRMDSIKLKICERVPSLGTSTSRLPSPALGLEAQYADNCLLQLSLSTFKWATMYKADEKYQQVSVRKIALGHESKPLLFFTEDMRSSTLSALLPLKDDLVVSIMPGAPSSRIDVRFKPAHIVLDLLQLDDVLSRSGGLSSILELGNSIVSTTTVKGGSPQPKPVHARPRSVRFDHSTRKGPALDTAASISGKLSLRLEGLSVDLVGSEAVMQVKTSAIKLAYRQNVAGLQISRAVITGPILPGSEKRADITINLTDIRLQYLVSPEEIDLDRLITLLTPSNDKYDEDDDIMVDTLLRQRRKGSVLRLTISELQSVVDELAWRDPLTRLLEELGKLSSVTKYLPDDDRPGILTFVLIKRLGARFEPEKSVGPFQLDAELLEAAHVSVPSLMAAQASTFAVRRNGTECIVGEVVSRSATQNAVTPPMLMCRFIADEMEPKVRLKMSNICVEYRVSTVSAVTDMIERLTSASNVRGVDPSALSSPSSSSTENSSKPTRRIGLVVVARNSAIGLTPLGSTAKGLVLLTDAAFTYAPSRRKDNTTSLDVKKASILIIDDTGRIDTGAENADQKLYFDENDQVQQLVKSGYVPIGYISSAAAVVRMAHDQPSGSQNLDVEFRNNLFILETCADSTQTLIQVLSNLSPPKMPSKVTKFRTEVVPIEDMLASFTGNAFVTSPGPEAGLQASPELLSAVEEDPEEDLEDDDTTYFPAHYDEEDEMAESYVDSELSQSQMTASLAIAPVGITESVSASSHEGITTHSLLDFRSDHFSNKSNVGGTAHRWDSKQNTYGLGTERDLKELPLKVRVRDVHIIWNLFDGYDWQSTRDTISKAVEDIETKAASRRPRSKNRMSPRAEDDEESVIGDFLFNSIYIGIPASKSPGDLTSAINHDIGDQASETGSYATSTTATAISTRQQSFQRPRTKKLRLARSRHHKMTFELRGVSADLLVFPAGTDEVESSLDIRVRDLEIFDHVPTSTWKKFATYMHDAGEREVDTNMVHLEILNVKPVPDLAASEMVLKITVLPLRLHVDQDALDFMTRFFEFKDDRAAVSSAPSTPPFLQRVEVNPVRLRLDFKPKRVDYGGLRSGRTTEFMNFFVLDRADMVLRRVILYGVSGFDRMGIMLNNIWTPDVKRNQLAGILSSLAPIRPITDVSSGLRELVAVPMREYKKDGRIVRSIQKGALAFATTTTKELVNFGAKLAIGTQTVLESAETMLAPGTAQLLDDANDDEKKHISQYADQPVGIVQGLRGAYASLERDLLLAKDAVIAVPGEVMASGSATGAAQAVLRSSPTIILRPAIGASKAVGQTLLGAGNAMDKRNLRRMEEKYKPGR